jgi:hypothetical protein
LRKRFTNGSRNRTELMFQVATTKRIGLSGKKARGRYCSMRS